MLSEILLKKVSDFSNRLREKDYNDPKGYFHGFILISEDYKKGDLTRWSYLPGRRGDIIEKEEDVGKRYENTNSYIVPPRRYEEVYEP